MFKVSLQTLLAAALFIPQITFGEETLVMRESRNARPGEASMTPLREGLIKAKPFRKKGQSRATYINVRVFPILQAPRGEPYPISQIRDVADLQHADGLELWAGNKKIGPTAKDIQLSFKDKKFYFRNFAGGAEGEVMELPVQNVWIRSVKAANPTRVIYNKGLGTLESDRTYRGEFSVFPTMFNYTENGQQVSKYYWSLVNVVDLEEYLYSVIPSEVPSSWHAQALQAQAVAARTYAVKELIEARKLNQPWDVDPTTQYQSYRGTKLEQATTNAAVEKTRGIVMAHKGQIFLAFFSANSGGITCSAKECLDRPDAPFAISKSDDIEMETQNQPGGTWSGCTSLPLIKYFLADWGYASPKPDFALPPTEIDGKKRPAFDICLDADFAKLVNQKLSSSLTAKSLETLTTSSSGRTWQVTASLASGKKVQIVEEGKTRIRQLTYGRQSYLFEIKSPLSNGLIEFKGHGYGHGVGMSQWGAKLRADKNQTYEQILKFYYNEITFENLNKFAGGAQ